MSDKVVAVAVFHSHEHAYDVVRGLQDVGFDMQSLSIVGKGFYHDQQSVGDISRVPRMLAWGRLGDLWGTMWGLVAGVSDFRFSDLGSVLVAGPLVLRILGAMNRSHVTGDANALGSAYTEMGIPQNRITHYEFLVKMDKVLLVIHGAPEAVKLSQTHLHNHPMVVHSEPATLVA